MTDSITQDHRRDSSRIPAINLASLSDSKRKLIEQRLRSAGPQNKPTIGPRDPNEPVAVSDAQLGLVLLDQAHEDLNAYNVAQAIRIRGRLDVDALLRAVDTLVVRHEVLRTRFTLRDGVPHADVDEPSSGAVDRRTLSGEHEIGSFVRDAVSSPLALADGRLLRAHLGSLGDEDHVFVLVTHHIASDAKSKHVLARELDTLYTAYSTGAPVALGGGGLQYADYAAWQQHRSNRESDVDWWRATLAGVPDEIELPADRARPAAADYSGAKYTRRLTGDVVPRLEQFARDHRTTSHTVLLAVYALLLERYSAQGDIVVGSPTSGRRYAELADVIGLFLNTLPLRIDTSGDPTFTDLVDRVRTTTVDAFRHQDVAFDRIVDAAQPTRAVGRNPVFQTMFTLKHNQDASIRLGDLDVVTLGFEGGWTKFDLTVICHPVADGLAMLWQYATSRFERATVAQLAENYETALHAVLEAPDTRVSALPLASVADRADILAEVPGEPRPGRVVHDLIAAQVRRTPDAPAVGDDSGWITYRELDERANRLARHLCAHGVVRGSRVAIFVPRSIHLEVALLAIMKAGAAYVPLDVSYPAERLSFMLTDSAAAAVVTTSAVRDRAPAHDVTIVLDDLDLSDVSGEDPGVEVTPDDLVYVLYTSGTTGRPKGVQLEHHSVASQLMWMQSQFGVDGRDTVLQKTPISFDVAGWEALLAPVTGARLFMAAPGGHADPDYLIDVITAERVTVVNFVPSMLAVFIDRPAARRCTSLRYVWAAGEALPDVSKDACLDALPRAELWNIYGPTETIGITAEQCLPERGVTIGRAVGDCWALVLDAAFGLQPTGMPGELFLGGAQVARGYLGRPDLTAQRFLDTPFGRMYRTGDRAVRQPDGRLQYLGRLDDQVKLRGFRIELGEVEAALVARPGVAAACATLVTAPSGEPSLAAFVTLTAAAYADADLPAAHRDAVLDGWRETWDATYNRASPHAHSFDTRGWNSSLTGRPVPEAEMREWVNTTVARIGELAPRSILEIGCGTGLLMWRLAPKIERYDATDVSAAAMDTLAQRVPAGSPVTARALAADQVTAPEPDIRYDCVVINSVVQYFPDSDYLREVLGRALELVRPGGSVFVGDVRDLRLHETSALQTTAALSPSVSGAELRMQLAERVADEPELLVHPSFFDDLPGVEHVQVLPRRGWAATEMNRYRYDVVLHTTGTARTVDTWHRWSDLAGLDALTALAMSGQEFGVSGIANGRVANPARELAELAAGRPGRGDFSLTGVQPKHLYALAERSGHRLELSAGREASSWDAAFVHDDRPVLFAGPADEPAHRPTNEPVPDSARARTRTDHESLLRSAAAEVLPSYMVPQSVRVLESLPITPIGKVDRRALATLSSRISATPARVAPHTVTEKRLAELWQRELGLEELPSVEDSFFDVGGSSILALKIFPKIEREFRVKLALDTLFDNATVARLARVLDAQRSGELAGTQDLTVPIRLTGTKIPLFLMPNLRGDALAYRQLATWLDPDRPLIGLQCIGLDGHRTPRLSIEAIGADCIEAIRGAQPKGPYALGGYCFGGVVAYEVAAQLTAQGEQVAFLGVIDATPFGRTVATPLTTVEADDPLPARKYTRLQYLRASLELGGRFRLAVGRVFRLLGVRTPRRFVDVVAANRRALRAYVTPDAPVLVTLFQVAGRSATREDVRRRRWEAVAGTGVRTTRLTAPGLNHLGVVRAEFAPQLAAAIDEAMRDCP